MPDEQEWEYYRVKARDVLATVTDEQKREYYEQDARRLADVFRASSKTPLDAAATVTAISRVVALMAIQPLQDVGEYIDQAIVTYAAAAGIIAEDPEGNSQPGDVVIDPADFLGTHL